MGERTSHAPGTFSWVDLATTDADGAKAFYGTLLGWEFEDMPVPDSPPYSMATIGGRTVAALYPQREDQAPPGWLSYVTVDHADATAARRGARRHRALRAVRRARGRPHGRAAGPDGRGVRDLAGEAEHRRAARQRRRVADDEPAEHARPGRRAGVLRRAVRVDVPAGRRRRAGLLGH